MQKGQYFINILWHNDKVLALSVLLFILGQVFFTYKGVETLPFFNYGMYSAPCLAKEKYTVLRLQKNGGVYPLPYSISGRKRALVLYNMYYAQALKEGDPIRQTIDQRLSSRPELKAYFYHYLSNDTSSIEAFDNWLPVYLEEEQLELKQEVYEFKQGRFSLYEHS